MAAPSDRSGARPEGRRALPRLGAGDLAGRGRSRRSASPARSRVPWVPLRARACRRGGNPVCVPPRRRARPTPTPRRASSRTARTARPRSSTRPPSAGPTAGGPASRERARSSTSCTSARSPRRAPGTPPAASCRSWRGLGITVLEVMPVAEFPGRFGWGYDGVDLFAPTRLYGTPDDFRALRGPGPRRSASASSSTWSTTTSAPTATTSASSPRTTSPTRHRTDWGEAINFDGADSGPVREFFLANAGYWIDEFHLDGLRLDATQDIYDASAGAHPDGDRAAGARARAGRRSVFLVAENEPQDARLVRPVAAGGYGLDALWNDDFHHTAMVALTGRERGVLHATTRAPRRSSSRPPSTATSTRGSATPGKGKRRGTPALGRRRRRPSSTSSRTTTRSPTPRPGCAATG